MAAFDFWFGANGQGANRLGGSVLSVRFEAGDSLLLAPAGADKRGPIAPGSLVENAEEYSRRFAREYPLELRREPGLTESTDRGLMTANLLHT